MGSRRRSWWVSSLLLFFSCICCTSRSQGLSNISGRSERLDAIFQDYAFNVLRQPRTRSGTLYPVSLPANFSGVQVSVIRQKTGSLWARGANFSHFLIPPKVLPRPYVRRVAVVYENLGNRSSSYFGVPGHRFVAPVLGFFLYNATAFLEEGSRAEGLNIRSLGAPISVDFSKLVTQGGSNTSAKCVGFEPGRAPRLSDMRFPNLCVATEIGHFSIVIPAVSPASPGRRPDGRGKGWKTWVIAVGSVVAGLVLLALVGFSVFKLGKRRKIAKMDKQAEEGEVLGSLWIGGSKMPSAAAVRTQPVLESEYQP